MGKKKTKAAAGDYWDNEFQEDAELVGATTATTLNFNGEQTVVEQLVDNSPAVEDLDNDGEGLMAMMKKAAKKGKNNKNNNNENAEPSTENADNDGEIRIKSKKEKERERKERQKQQQQKKKEPPAKKAAPVEVEEPKMEAPSVTAPPPAIPADASGKGKKKKAGPPVAALREMMAARQAAEEEARRLEEEERKREEERLRKIAEEEAAREEARRLKKEKEKAKIERLKKEGKYLTDAERKRQKMAQLKLEQLKAQGVVVPALDEQQAVGEEDEEAKKPKRVVYDNRKKKKGGKTAEATPKVEQVKAAEAENAEVADSWEEVADSWEQIEEKADEDQIADSWEDNDEGDDVEEVREMVEKISTKETPSEAKTNKTQEISKSQSASVSNKKAPAPAPAQESEDEEDESEESDSDSDDSSDYSDSSDEGLSHAAKEALRKKQEAKQRREQRHREAMKARSKDDLRSPICVILGHVDTGKTKLLDKIRQTNVQEGEAGGITQQIGATYFPTDSVKTKTEGIPKSNKYDGISEKTGFKKEFDIKVPGLLVIDTPGHESFTNLRSRGSSLCNIAILVVDIMHGLEPQTIESINLLKQRKTPFIVALNKIDRIFGWKETPNNPVLESFAKQPDSVMREFNDRFEAAKLAFAEQGLNAELFHKNPDVRKYVSMVPTSAITGEGIPDLLMLLIQLAQERLTDSLMYLSELQATVLEVKVIEGLGTTIDVILVNGVLNEGDRILVCGLNGPIITTIRALLTPQPMRELRVKSAYVHHKSIKAAMGVKVCAPDLEKAIAGSRLLVLGPDDDEDELKEEVMSDLTNLFESIDKTGRGVCVQASTLGSLEALLSFLKDSKIPVSGINIGPIHKKDVIRASVMLEHAKEYSCILAFDVKVDKDAQEMADEMGVKIFKADIIYHLFDQFTAYMKNLQEQKRADMAPQAIWPCWLRIVPGCIFNKNNPIIIGVEVLDGTMRIGTPLCVPCRGNVMLGKVAGIELNHKAIDVAKKGQQVAVRIELPSYEPTRSFGRHFGEKDEIVSKVSRQSIDILKEGFRDEVSKEEWLLIKRLKPILGID